MSKQRLDPEKIANELKGASSFFKPHPLPAPEPARDDLSADPAPDRPTAPVEAAPSARHNVTTSRRHDVTSAQAVLDINQETASHDTLRLAVNETKALEALKSALKWEHDLTVSKNDICRVALHALLEEYRAKGAASDALKRLRKKRGR